jgi:hypothetical protein
MKLVKGKLIEITFLLVVLFSLIDVTEENFHDWLMIYGLVALLLFTIRWSYWFGEWLGWVICRSYLKAKNIDISKGSEG